MDQIHRQQKSSLAPNCQYSENLTKEEDVWDVFTRYITGEPNAEGINVTKTIFNEDSLSGETALISEQLAEVNKKGVLL